MFIYNKFCTSGVFFKSLSYNFKGLGEFFRSSIGIRGEVEVL